MIELLDHGYLNTVETWGTEERIIESARMSTGKGFLGWGPNTCSCVNIENHPERRHPVSAGRACEKCGGLGQVPGDEKLLRFLWENGHSTPFEMVGATFEVQAPIMVFREWHRHRVPFGYNELSARYTPLPDVSYVPTPERIVRGARKAGRNKQAAAMTAEFISDESAIEWLDELRDVYEHIERVYQSGLRRGVPKELARLPVAVGRYSRMRATGNLRGWLAFLQLRDAPNAQEEIRVYARAVHDELVKVFPRTLALFDEKRA